MEVFLKVLDKLPEFQEAARVGQGGAVNIVGVSQTQKAHIIAALMKKTDRRAVVISSNELSARQIYNDLGFFLDGEVVLLPVDEPAPLNAEAASRDNSADRIKAVDFIAKGASAVMSAAALLCFVMPKKQFTKLSISFKVGQEYGDIAKELVNSGYLRTPVVTGPGQFCVRGGIVDIYSPDSPPYRIEFFGDEIDSIRIFDVESQLSTEKLEAAKILPALPYGEGSILDYFEDDTLFVFDEPHQVSQAVHAFSERMEEMAAQMILREKTNIKKNLILDYDHVLNRVKSGVTLGISGLSIKSPDYKPDKVLRITAKGVPPYTGKIDLLSADVRHWLEKEYKVFILAGSESRAQGVYEALEEAGTRSEIIKDDRGPIEKTAGIYEHPLGSGFEYPHIKAVFISGTDIFRKKHKKRRKAADSGRAIKSFDELTPGDYVVHQSHGIGRFEELCNITVEGISRDYLKISYKNSDVLYVPVNQLNLIYRYSYAGDEVSTPKLSRLGGAEWSRAKSRVKSSVKQLAIKLIEIYAERSRMIGHAFSKDGPWQSEFEDSFPYEETPEQLRSIDEMKRDMESKRPMDRLLCGDVGYGKTEVAIRGAFKCVTDGLQCAYLVPTTILAAQHYNLFVERMKNYPIRIEMLSRFRTAAEQKKILAGVKSSEIDIIIGTHRLLGDDVNFKRLGLLIVDEEQRFGVGHKEKIKNLKRGIDVLTLTATPIPRTLNMAMMGIRDMSVITQPPEERQPIQTYVLEYDNGVVKDAIDREVSRGGQVFYVYNRVAGIYSVAQRLGEMIPEAKIAVAHGRMNETELENVMMQVVNKEVDVLVCTTIIESGIDIPNVNTLIVENADHMGLAQLYQIRGRVGRSNRVAYAYLMFKRDKALSEVAEKRLIAIKEFTEFGAGFKIALRDLEIRGAGNMLGPEQHGFLATVGYDMYLKLLDETVRELSGEEKKRVEAVIDINLEAVIPKDYIEDDRMRLAAYRMIADIEGEEEAREVLDEFIDRYGDIGDEVYTLMEVSLLRVYAGEAGVSEISQKGQNIILYFDGGKIPDIQRVSHIAATYPGKIMFGAGERPNIAVRGLENDGNMLKNIKKLLKGLKVE